MYCICQNDNNLDKIIKIVKSKDNFLQKIQKYEGDQEYTVLNDMNTEQIKNDPNIKLGFYLLNNDQICLIEKYENIVCGYIYNTTYTDVKIIKTWRLIPYEKVQNKDNKKELANDQKVNEIQYRVREDKWVHNPLFKANNTLTVNSHPKIIIPNKDEICNIVEQFNINEMITNPICLITGKNNQHKNSIIKKIINEQESDMLIISTSHDLNLSRNYPLANYYNEYNSQTLINFMNNKDSDKKRFIILDNFSGSNVKIIKDPTFLKLIYNCKYLKINIIITTPFSVSSYIKTIFDYIFVLQDDNYTCEKVYKNYYNECIPYDAFKRKFYLMYENNMCIVTNYKQLPETLLYYKIN
jgi:hypothetical protein